MWKNTSPRSPPIANEIMRYCDDSLVFGLLKKAAFIKKMSTIGTTEINRVDSKDCARNGNGRIYTSKTSIMFLAPE